MCIAQSMGAFEHSISPEVRDALEASLSTTITSLKRLKKSENRLGSLD